MDDYFNIEEGYCKSSLFAEFNHQDVFNRDLNIYYMVRKAQVKTDQFLCFFNGGPGVGFSTSFKNLLQDSHFFPYFNVVCIDQRGTGQSSKPANLKELMYFSARYIAYDAEKIRQHVLGKDRKWILFGESYGGHIVRKYLELYPKFIEKAISFGYGKNDPVDMKVYIQMQNIKMINDYFLKYPEDEKTISQLKTQLKESDLISSEKFKVSGMYLADFLVFWFGLKEEDDIHESIMKFREGDLVLNFKKEIQPLANILLNTASGKLNPTVAYIDILDGFTDEKLNEQVQKKLNDLGYNHDNLILSSKRLTNHIEPLNEDLTDKEYMQLIKNGYFKPDFIDYNKIIEHTNQYNIEFNILASIDDFYTPVQIIKDEEVHLSQLTASPFVYFHYVAGSHHAWLHHNHIIFKNIL